MSYNYDHDCPFEAFITNLGKYNEGELVGEWVKFPTTYEKLQEVFQRIGIGSQDLFGNVYEEWFITDYDCYVDGLYDLLGEYANLDELNYLASKLEEMDNHEYEHFMAAMEISDYTGNLKDLINLTDNLDKYQVIPGVEGNDDLGRYYIEELGTMEVPEHLKNYIDYEAYGRDISLSETSSFTENGYVYDTQDSFTEYYTGDRDDIPPEYLVSKKPEDVTVRLDQSTDLAYDLDVFFRNYNPEYNVMFPDEHIQKKALADALLEDMTPEIKNGLANMAREQDLREEVEPLVKRLDDYEKEYGIHIFSIYQLKRDESTRDLRFEPLDRLHSVGHSVDMENYDLIYSDHYSSNISLESIYQKFNIDHPEDFRGHSLSVSDVVVIQQNGMEEAYFCDRFGFAKVPEFLESVKEPVGKITFYAAECMEFTSLGEYHENLTLQEAVAAYQAIPADRMNGIKGIGFTLEDDSIYDGMSFPLVQGSTLDLDTLGTVEYYKENPLVRQAVYGVMQELPDLKVIDRENYLKAAELSTEDDYGMIDGIINNGKREDISAGNTEKPSIREKLADAKKECAERKTPDKKLERSTPEHDSL